MSVAEFRHRANELHFRLRNPPNAVPDRDIQMRRGAPVEVLRPFAKSPLNEVEFHMRCLEFFNKSVEARPKPEPEAPISRGFLAQATIRHVAQFYGLSVNDIVSDRRTQNVVMVRWICMWMLKEITGQSLPWIGKRLAGRDHTTVMHGLRKIEQLRKTDQILQNELNQFLSALRPTMEKSNAEHITSRFRD
jgi:hypothetical protein